MKTRRNLFGLATGTLAGLLGHAQARAIDEIQIVRSGDAVMRPRTDQVIIVQQQIDPEKPFGFPKKGDTIFCNGIQMKATNCTPKIRLSGADGGSPCRLIVRGIDCRWYPLDICEIIQTCRATS